MGFTFSEDGDGVGDPSIAVELIEELVMVSFFVVEEYHLNIFKLGNCKLKPAYYIEETEYR